MPDLFNINLRGTQSTKQKKANQEIFSFPQVFQNFEFHQNSGIKTSQYSVFRVIFTLGLALLFLGVVLVINGP